MRRLRTQRVLTATSTVDFWKDGVVKSGTVELKKFPLIEMCDIWTASCLRIWFVRSSGCCCRFLCDSITNAVTTAENKPAYLELV